MDYFNFFHHQKKILSNQVLVTGMIQNQSVLDCLKLIQVPMMMTSFHMLNEWKIREKENSRN